MSYPVSLNITNKICVVIGGGCVSVRKVKKLLKSGANVKVIAPDASNELHDLAVAKRINLLVASYDQAHLDGAFLVIAATDNHEVNEAISRDAEIKGVLVCRSDSNTKGDFSSLASVDRGYLTLCVSTNGVSPTLSAIIKMQLEATYGPEWDSWSTLFGLLRTNFQNLVAEPLRLETAQRILDNAQVRSHILAGEIDAAKTGALSCF